jgi:pyruvate/2-oxoglutarate dehydrogenase complex dihydrolipoamide acyltransferase (E2) component
MAGMHKLTKTRFIGGAIREAGEEISLELVNGKLEETPAQIIEEEEPSINATVAALQLAEEAGIDIDTVTGTGEDGRIGKPDVQAAINALEDATAENK